MEAHEQNETSRTDPQQLMSGAKKPISVLSGPEGHPFHPILVTVPIGAWVASLIFDLIARQAGSPEAFARGSYWLIGIGVVAAFVAAVFGLLDLLAIPRGTRAWRVGITHMTLNLAVVGLFTVSWVIRLVGDYAVVPVWLIVYSGAVLVVLGVSGWLGGMLAYRYGVRVVSEDRQADGYKPARSMKKAARDLKKPA